MVPPPIKLKPWTKIVLIGVISVLLIRAAFGWLGRMLVSALRQLVAQLWAYSLVLCVAIGILIFLYHGYKYWSSLPGLTWQTCVYGNSQCSASVATWTLAAFALLSFGAAARAVNWTRKLFEIEIQLKLGQSSCSNHSEEHISKEIFVTDGGQVLLDARPTGFTKAKLADYHEHHVAFINLGRTALADAHVHLCFADPKNVKSQHYPVHLGSIRCNDEIHVGVYIPKTFQDMRVLWGEATEQERRLDFFPVDPIVSEAKYAVPTLQLPLQGMAKAGTPGGGGNLNATEETGKGGQSGPS